MRLIYFYLFLRATNVKLPAVKTSEDVAKFIFLRTEFLNGEAERIRLWADCFLMHHRLSDINQGCNIKNKSLIPDENAREICLTWPGSQRNIAISKKPSCNWINIFIKNLARVFCHPLKFQKRTCDEMASPDS